MTTIATVRTEIEELIGDYQAFFVDLLQRLKKIGVDVTGLPMVQLLYRVATIPEYEILRDQLKIHCSEFVESKFNGRAISTLVLKEPLVLAEGFEVSVIELPAPRAVHMYPSGLESMGILVGASLPAFIQRHKNVLSGVKDHGHCCQPAFVTFEHGKTVKFYDYTLQDIVINQGWRLEQLTLPRESYVNLMADTVNTWQWYLRGLEDWRTLINGHQPKVTGCGIVYELNNHLMRPNESFAIADMRNLRVSEPHYHVESEVYIVLQGSGLIVVGGQETLLQKDTAVVIPSQVAHFTIPKDDLVLAVVNNPPFCAENYKVLTTDNKAVGFDKEQFDRLGQGSTT